MSKTNINQHETIFSCFVRAGTSTLALNCTNNRLIAAGQQNFQLFSIESIDNIEQFKEIHDFRNAPRQPAISRYAFQPKDVSWNPNDENCFATVSGTSGYLYIWDATRLITIDQLNIHNTIINRLQFHPKHPNLLLTASQDGYAKLIDFRINNVDKVITSFRHSSKEGFRDIDINISNTHKFASVINDQYSVPIWDIRQPTQPDFSIVTRDKVLCIAWNPHEHFWLATGGIGGHDRTIRIWDGKGNDSRQEPLFTVYTFGQVTKLSWRPTCRYHIACFTRTADPRIHVWDIRRPYLPQASFCHHRNDIEDFLWRPNSDNIISVGRDERLIHAHISSAVQSEQIVSIFSLNVTSKGSIYISMPNIDNDYVRSLYNEQHIPLSSSNLRILYSQETLSTFLKWDKIIKGESILGIYSNTLHDNSIQLFHQFARRWIFGNGDKSLIALANICDINSTVSEDLNRPDLKATWQVIKMLYVDYDALQNYRTYSSKTSQSITISHHISDSISNHRYHYHQPGRKLTIIDKQRQDNRSYDELTDEKRIQLQEQRILTNSKLEMIDDTETYIVRDVLTDDIIFITPEDVLNYGNTNDMSYDNDIDLGLRRDSLSIPLIFNEPLPLTNTDGDCNKFSLNRITRQLTEVIILDDDDEMRHENEYDSTTGNMQTSIHSTIPDDSENFFTIDESYCPTIQKHSLNFDDVIRQTLWYYIENNELQVAVHLLLALYPQLNERKRIELFNGAHLQWLVMYIELLQKMRLFVKAKQVTKHCIENEGIPLSYNPSEFDGSIIFAVQTPTLKRFSAITSPTISSTSKNSPSIVKEFMCSICRIPCRGLFSFCGVCSHGGHIDHIQTWFKIHDECPYGCGHQCQYFDNQNCRSFVP
ncbi:unnamed protein product [Rotaria sordida]|uniref:GATOR2 complex protein WDR24 n=2 Tax=Rotaria sordida TaxID=392033 RepID=A0A814TG49_9BILA|nr:unnamed protein product [Rotaria sordida]CAF1412031.1 unnamed protein product [Rotaria sordida]